MNRDLSPKTVGVRGLDVGYFNTKFTTGVSRDGRRALETALFPSQAPLADLAVLRNRARMTPLLGETVRVEGLDRYVGPDVQAVLKGAVPNPVTERYSTSPEYKALTYGAFSRMAQISNAGELRIETLVVGLPPSRLDDFADPLAEWLTGSPHRIDYGNSKARVVVIERALVVAQPYGALLDYFHTAAVALKGTAVVVDVGGGTLDWFVATASDTDWSRTSSHNKGMLAVAHAVASAIDPDLRNNPRTMKAIDDAIRSDEDKTFVAHGKDRDVRDFQATIDAVLKESCDQMMDSLQNVGDVRTFIFTGGGAKVFAKYMRERLPEMADLFHVHKEPLFGNVRGFHLAGQKAHALEEARAA